MKRIGHTAVRNQDGFASIVIAIVMVLILSLITVSFATLMNREQRQALDKQLSSQAYYAAESGVNMAAKAISNGYKEHKTECKDTTGQFADNTVSLDTGSSFPCLLINPTPPTIVASTTPSQSRIYEMTGVDDAGAPQTLQDITISWKSKTGSLPAMPASENCSSGRFKSNAAWGGYISPIRFQVVPIREGEISRTNLINDSLTAFLCPQSGGGTLSYANEHNSGDHANDGSLHGASCPSGSNSCSVTIDLSGDAATDRVATYFINFEALYSATIVTVSAHTDGGKPVNLSGAQTLVDSTGKAQDVLRRIQVRVSSKPGSGTSDSYGTALDATSAICKQLSVMPQTLADGTAGTSSRNGADGCDGSGITNP